jgi:hypothetical protein
MIEFDRPWKYEKSEGGYEGHGLVWPDVIPYEIFPHDLDKRASAMLDILSNPKSNHKYSVNQAINLANICTRSGRQDLAEMIRDALI